jgi:hypothetical protein
LEILDSKYRYFSCTDIVSRTSQEDETELQTDAGALDKENVEVEDSSRSKSNLLQLLLPIKRLSFETILNEVSVSVITLYNKGNVTVFFEWVPEKKPNRFMVF